jgi:hypothetical protein
MQTKFVELLLEVKGAGYECPWCVMVQKPRSHKDKDDDRQFCLCKSEGTQCSRFNCMECYKDEDRKFCVYNSEGTKCTEFDFVGCYHACLILLEEFTVLIDI